MPTAAPIQVQTGPWGTVITTDLSPESGRRIHAALTMMGTAGVELRQAEAGLSWAWTVYRRNQGLIRKGWNYGGQTMAGGRSFVREALARLRAARLQVAA